MGGAPARTTSRFGKRGPDGNAAPDVARAPLATWRLQPSTDWQLNTGRDHQFANAAGLWRRLAAHGGGTPAW
eukprot:1721212-Lingulodinium_polyedra.AAC.1